MPYTPPSQSPAASPISSRTPSISLHERPSTKPASTSNPPRSSSFSNAQRSRRSSAQTPPGPTCKSDLSRSLPNRSGSLHQSPPPVNHGSFIPTGAIISPPDSIQNSSDDDDAPSPVEKRRGRQLEGELDELKEALKHIPQRRVPSPDNTAKHTSPTDLQPLSPRKYSHSRSTSDSSYLRNLTNKSGSGSDAEDDAYRIAPPMVRKKSGELVKSSLKTPNRSRPSSAPSTPTFPKVVHFDSHLEHVRHFHKVEKPSAVSAGSSPVDSYDGETEFPFDYEDGYRSPPFEWEIGLPNFPKDLSTRKHMPVRVERVYLSTDKLNLLGTVSVANIAYQKLVVVRFTLDFWQTVSEVTAEYNSDVRRRQKEENVDRFTFKIKLHDQANLESKTLFFCVRYNAAGQEMWDNNNSMNFQVDFKKKMLPQNGKGNCTKVALPRSRPSLPRNMSMPNLELLDSFDDDAPIVPLERAAIQMQLPGPKSADIADPARRSTSSGNAFSNRYDFSASLSAAITAANTIMGPAKSGLTKASEAKEVVAGESPYFAFGTQEARMKSMVDGVPETVVSAINLSSEERSTTPLDSPSKTGAGPPEIMKSPEKPPIGSLSYRELLETYCFFGSAKTSPHLHNPPHIVDSSPNHDTYTSHGLLSAYTLGSGVPKSRSPSPPRPFAPPPLLDVTQSPRYTPPNGSPPSLSGSQRSSPTSSPVPFGTYQYQPRRSHGFTFDAPHATAIRG